MTKTETKKINEVLRKVMFNMWGEKCLKCGKTERLQMSHIKSKGAYPALRFEPLNVKPLCFRCHLHWWHKEPLEASEWFKTVMPEESMKQLNKIAQECNNGSRKTPKFKEHMEYLESLMSS